jgi:hypothetical protein
VWRDGCVWETGSTGVRCSATLQCPKPQPPP